MKSLVPRKIMKGNGDKFSLTFDSEEITRGGLVFATPIDISGWQFSMLVHKNVEYRCRDLIFQVEGEVPTPENGVVYFFVPAELTDVKPGTYWYSLLITKPTGGETLTLSAKYIIAESLNPYFSIYKHKM